MITQDTPSLFVPNKAGGSAAIVSNRSLPMATNAGAVLYIDGGSRPNPGFGGLGIHGYIYTMDEPKRGTGCKKGVPSTRGYVEKASNKEKPITLIKYIDGYSSIAHGTNQTAEQSAAIAALEKIMELREEFQIGRLMLLADSKYVIDGISQWVHGWVANGWRKSDGSEIANLALWQRLYELVNELQSLGLQIDWSWVKGHDGDIGNCKADYLATCGVITAKKGIDSKRFDVVDAQGYWSASVPYNRLLNHSKWYFNTNVGGALKTEDGRFIYHLGNHGKDDELLGKRISDARFSVLFFEQPIKAMELVREYQDRVSEPGEQCIVIGRLDNILQAENHQHILRHGDLHFDTYGRRKDIGLPSRADESESEDSDAKYCTQLTKVLTPPRLAQNAVTILSTLELVLNQYCEDPVKHDLCVTDITATLYEVEVGKKASVCKLKKAVTSSMRSIEVDVNYNVIVKSGIAPIILTLDIDTPDRNALAAIAEFTPKVSVVTWRESDTAFRYAVIVESGKDCGIWAGVYSNFKVLPNA